jgi:hypothetical protein
MSDARIDELVSSVVRDCADPKSLRTLMTAAVEAALRASPHLGIPLRDAASAAFAGVVRGARERDSMAGAVEPALDCVRRDAAEAVVREAGRTAELEGDVTDAVHGVLDAADGPLDPILRGMLDGARSLGAGALRRVRLVEAEVARIRRAAIA